jgi:ABC-2 type transport system permease protein
MRLVRALQKAGWFFLRDLAIARSYRVVFLFELIETLLGVAAFYYLSRFIEVPSFAQNQPAGGYFAFAVVGFAFFDYLTVALSAFDQSLEEARRNGTLEYLLVTQTSLPVILAGSAIYPFVLLSLRTTAYLGWAVFLFDFPVSQANWIGAILILGASILAFAGLGVLSASYSLLFKRGNPVKWLFLGVAGLVSGIMYPVTVLPPYLQFLGGLVPVTYSWQGMRVALLQHASLSVLWPTLRSLLLFALILLPLSLAVFSWAIRRTKVTGTLTHF